MSETTGITWTDSTFNPWIGCTKVSPGCAHCYAESEDARRKWTPDGWGKGKARKRTSESYWKQPLKWDRNAANELADWQKHCDLHGGHAHYAKPKRPRVFCASLADWLDDEVPIEWLADLLKLIHDTPNLDWQLLTKRPGAWHRLLSDVYEANRDEEFVWMLRDWLANDNPPKNVWIGTSVEDQQRADERIPHLLKIPAKVRFLSVEPLLEDLDLEYPKSIFPKGPQMCCDGRECGCRGQPIDPPLIHGIHWVIVGGESGPNARPCYVEWVQSIVDQCKSADVAIFVKQLGRNVVGTEMQKWVCRIKDPKGGNMTEWPEELRIREFPSLSAAKSECSGPTRTR